MNVDRLLADLEPWQFLELHAYYRLKPWGDDWMQAASIEAAIRQVNGQEVYSSELIPNEDNREQNGEPTAADVRDGFRAMAGF